MGSKSYKVNYESDLNCDLGEEAGDDGSHHALSHPPILLVGFMREYGS